ncbi:ubiquitin-protein ligase E3B [Thrips palmi]|uniref:Ubiquitin-protein ligase E3B n=1 Tax=Thrips palmi TaxID=161013 RepID=A0A6P9A070_THRPL|nr:ubiquitin-protein ligase E3B [Thrips palmi]XP_034250733.1 ubiquitin-protein ligase E3B [Thrips palmi]XP_034250744.1 ubiquitin-protein ligase E3B [Thrips palmi]
MFDSPESKKDELLEQARTARKERELEKKKCLAASCIQAHFRGLQARREFSKTVLEQFDTVINDDPATAEKLPALQAYQVARRFMLVWKQDRDVDRVLQLCRYLVSSLESESPRYSYVGIALNKEHVLRWISHMKNILSRILLYIDGLKPERPVDCKSLMTYLHTLIAFTSTSTWVLIKSKNFENLRPGLNHLCSNIMGHLASQGLYQSLQLLLKRSLCRSTVVLKHASLSAAVTLALRPLIAASFSDKLSTIFLIHILSVPALVSHIQTLAPECLTLIEQHSILRRSFELLSIEQNLRIVFNALEGNYALCLLANLIQLAHFERETTLPELAFPTFTVVVTRLLESCMHYVMQKQSPLAHWHPVLGWFAQSTDAYAQEAMPLVKQQLHLLWSGSLVKLLLGQILAEFSEKSQIEEEARSPAPTNIIRRALENRVNRASSAKSYRKLGSPEFTKVALVCSLYQTALSTLTQLSLDILTGLCYQDKVLYHLWSFLCSLGPNCGLKAFLELLAVNIKCTAPEFQMLILFCNCMTNYVTILDDMEMYDQQEPFKITDYVTLSNFLNLFLYRSIYNQLFDLKSLHTNPVFVEMHTLLQVLYRRDCRRRYSPDNHWLIKEIRVSQFMADLEKGKKPVVMLLQKMPHIIPHEERVNLFRKHVANEKAVFGLTESACAISVSPQSTLITVHRSRIVEDGYRQLALLPPQSLKGVIRVRFINEQGLDEAGIDQDGVFKEFLEETIKRVFDPTLNLFKATSEERLYPSPTSYIQENHLQLFEFVGRMLGKAVYEGIVVDVPFASFFLSQVLGHTHQVLYSAMDELPSLDSDLYRSLTFIKHHAGDVGDLDLTFSVDQDCLGRVVTHELVPGGRVIPVTNENKINYIHLMAHFRMHTQIREQTAAFIRGFRSLINVEWLQLFSTPELQRLISGDNVPLDLRDLRRHTQYYGGFHDSHRVVNWLWDVLDRDFTEEERALFLKFVTSCSKPPLLGFAHLEPPFSIRCVEVGDDEDTGDTIASVIRGFFTIRKKDPQNRLPTSSTCFNLLKLPNYQKKSTLREKLRYAVSSNTGFELS